MTHAPSGGRAREVAQKLAGLAAIALAVAALAAARAPAPGKLPHKLRACGRASPAPPLPALAGLGLPAWVGAPSRALLSNPSPPSAPAPRTYARPRPRPAPPEPPTLLRPAPRPPRRHIVSRSVGSSNEALFEEVYRCAGRGCNLQAWWWLGGALLAAAP
jgi:hypothetical protein